MLIKKLSDYIIDAFFHIDAQSLTSKELIFFI